MEVWALEAHGAAHLLQEMLTVKSDDVEGRAIMYERLIKGRNYLEASRPVSFDVAVSEIRGLCLNLQMEKLGRVQDVRAEAAAGGDDIPAGGETSPGIAQETAGLLPGVVEDDAEAAEDDGRAVALDQPEQAEQTAQREE
jgi:hypothetical protein